MTLYKLPATYVESRRNLVRNPGFRAGVGGWSRSHGGGSETTLKRITNSAVPSGTGGYMRQQVTTAGTFFRATYALPAGTVTPGEVYTLLAWVTGTPASDVKLYVSWWRADNSWISEVSSPAKSVSWAAGWQLISMTVTAPATADRANVQVGRESGAVGHLLDTAGVAFGPGIEFYFDGDTESTTAVQYSWAGAANASESILSIPNASSTLEPIMTLAPYTARREAGTIVHRLLEDSQARFTWRQPNLPVGLFEFLFDGHATAYAALSKLSARTAWALVDDADDGPIERWFMIADGDLEMEQSREVENAYVVRVPYVEVDSI